MRTHYFKMCKIFADYVVKILLTSYASKVTYLLPGNHVIDVMCV